MGDVLQLSRARLALKASNMQLYLRSSSKAFASLTAEGEQLAVAFLHPGRIIAVHHTTLCMMLAPHDSLGALYAGYE